MRTVVAAFLAFGLAAQAAAPVPRQAPELTIKEASGKTHLLSQMKGKVVIVQFLYTWCPHCQDTAKMLSKLQTELGPQGLQVFGVAFNDEVNTKDAAKNALEQETFNSRYAQPFPVGRATKETVLKYLGLSVMERFGVPQMIVVDTTGKIVAQSKPMPTGPGLQDETYLRNLLKPLLPGAKGSGGGK